MAAPMPLSCPADFATVAIAMLNRELVEHYGRAWSTVARWLNAQPDDWRARRADAVKVKRTAAWLESSTKGRNARLVVVKARRVEAMTAPDGFVEAALQLDRGELARLFKRRYSGIGAIIDALPDDVRSAIAANFTARKAARARVKMLAYRAAHPNARQRPPKATKPRIRTKQSTGWGMTKALPASLPSGVDTMAMQHLMRATRLAPICKGETVYGKSGAGIYIVGPHKVDQAGLLEMAARHGWQADAWRQVAR